MTPAPDRPPLPLYIDSTMLSAFKRCPRMFFWEYILCLRPRGRKTDLVAGGAFAAAIEAASQAWFRDGERDMDRVLAAAYRAFAASWGDFPADPEGSYKTHDSTFRAVLDYFRHYPLASDPFQPNFVIEPDGSTAPTYEFSFGVPLLDPTFPRHPSGDPFLYSGRIDAFGTYHSLPAIRDEKTSGRAPTRRWSESWDLRGQFLGYLWALQSFGHSVSTVVVRGVTIQKTQSQHIEAVKTYPPELILRWYAQLARDLHRLVDCYNSGYFDYNFADACNAFGTPCAYTILCYTGPTAHRWFGEYDRERWDPMERASHSLPPLDLDYRP